MRSRIQGRLKEPLPVTDSEADEGLHDDDYAKILKEAERLLAEQQPKKSLFSRRKQDGTKMSPRQFTPKVDVNLKVENTSSPSSSEGALCQTRREQDVAKVGMRRLNDPLPEVTSSTSWSKKIYGRSRRKRPVQKPRSPGIPSKTERYEFYDLLSFLTTVGNEHRTTEYSSQTSYDPDDQSNIADKLWLELQAWNNERTVYEQEQFLEEKRSGIDDLVDKLLNFRYERIDLPKDSEGEELQNCDGCLYIYCQPCQMHMSRAMAIICDLLDEMDKVQDLYPSSARIACSYPLWLSEEFVSRRKALCCWVTTVRKLRMRIDIIGAIVRSSNRKVLWPDWPVWEPGDDISDDGDCHISEDLEKGIKCDVNRESQEAAEDSGNGSPEKFLSIPDADRPSRRSYSRVRFSDDAVDTMEVKRHDVHVDEILASLRKEQEAMNVEPDDENPEEFATPSPVPEGYRGFGTDDGEQESDGHLVDGLSEEPNFAVAVEPESPQADVRRPENFDSCPSDNPTLLAKHLSRQERFDEEEKKGDESEENQHTTIDVGIGSFNSDLTDSFNSGTEDGLSTPTMATLSHRKSYSSYPMEKSLRMAVELQLDMVDKSRTIYRSFVEQELKAKGLRRFLNWIDNLNTDLIDATHKTLSAPTGESEEERYGARSKPFKAMNLQSYQSLYYFICRIPLMLKLDCMNIHLEQTVVEPSVLSLKELIGEMRFLLTFCIKYNKVIEKRVNVLDFEQFDFAMSSRHFEDVEIYNQSLTSSLKVYLRYLKQYVTSEATASASAVHSSRDFLEDEWLNYVKKTAIEIRGGEIEVGAAFAEMASVLIRAISDALDVELDKPEERKDGVELSEKKKSLEYFRRVQKIFFCTKERALRLLSFVKELSEDTKRAAEFQLVRPQREVLKKLANTGHVRVVCPAVTKYQMFVPSSIRNMKSYILRLMNLECFWDAESSSSCDKDDEGEYIVILSQDDPVGKKNRDDAIVVDNERKPICLDSLELDGLLLITDSAADLLHKRRNFQKLMGDSLLLVDEGRPSHHIVANASLELKASLLDASLRITSAISEVEIRYNQFNKSFAGEPEHSAIMSRGRETINQCYKFGFEYHKALQRHVGGRLRADLAERIVQLAKRWMRHAVDRCERGRGLFPRWANHGLNFVTVASDPQITCYLSELGFEDLKRSISECLTHVIGTPHAPTKIASSRYLMEHSKRDASYCSSRSSNNASEYSEVSSNYGELADQEPSEAIIRRRTSEGYHSVSSFVSMISESGNGKARRQVKVTRAVEELEEQRDARLQHLGTIGKVKDVCPMFRSHIKSRTVNFPWQRGVKIGQGRFGKVFVAINMKNGEVYAMKEIPIVKGDYRPLRMLATELRIFEGIRHKNLVQYYGVEIHKDKMLIFMEYCAEGTLEALVDQMGEPLPEHITRGYTRQLLEAVNELHSHGILHRDIKSANIFLTDDGNCLKLGDYGCATKLKSHSTMAGELQGFVGTQLYMAPEIFTGTEKGHGRAADIWSVGCVVVEMATGKRPWHDLESNFAVMFRVGMGEHPQPPASFSADGKEFIEHCFAHEPSERWTAHELLDHQFVKIGEN